VAAFVKTVQTIIPPTETVAHEPSGAPTRRPRLQKFGRRLDRRSGIAALAVLTAVGSLAFAVGRGGRSEIEPITAAQVGSTIAKAIEKERKAQAAAPERSTKVYEAITPSLVVVRTDVASDGSAADDAGGLGSGVIVNDQGAILTADHVVAGATTIEVSFADGTTTRAEVIASDPSQDIALLQPEQLPEVLVPAVLGGGPSIGDSVYAVGNPLGLIGSMSGGVVSGLNRSVPVDDGARTLEGLIQFDAAVNPGNSGGPLLNRDAQVIGIVTASVNPGNTKSFSGIAFAIPLGAALGGVGIGPGPGGPVQ
jgi:S1-C subfamily serine protease